MGDRVVAAADLLRDARTRAGLSQRALAERVGTSHSVVARIDLGKTSPTGSTLTRVIEPAGFSRKACMEVRPELGSQMLAEVARIRALSVEERLAEVAHASRILPTIDTSV